MLARDEEVLIVRVHGPAFAGMTVGGAGPDYDVLRWDGRCVSLNEAELSRKRPRKPVTAQVQFRELDADKQEALLQDRDILELYKKRRRECQGVTFGAVSKPCAVASQALSRAIVEYVRRAGLQIQDKEAALIRSPSQSIPPR